MKNLLAPMALALTLAGCVSNPLMHKGLAPTPADESEQNAAATGSSALPAFNVPSGDPAAQAVDLAASLLDSYGVVANKSLDDYLGSLLAKVLNTAGVDPACCRVVVLSDLSLHAEARPSGVILLSMGWLLHAEDEAELVALLAHEFAHVLHSHHGSDVAASAPTALMQAVALGGQLAGRIPQLQGVLTNINYLAAATNEFLHPSWNRLQESEADRLAVDVVVRMGYSMARGPKAMLERIGSLEASAELKEEGAPDPKAAIKSWLSSIDRRHDEAKTRVDEAIAYYETTWENSPSRPRLRPQPRLEDVRAKPDVAKLLSGYRTLGDAQAALSAGQPHEALDKAKAGGAFMPASLLAAMTMCDVQVALKDNGNIRRCMVESTKLAGGSWLPFRFQATWLKENGGRSNAVQVIETGFAALGRPKALLPEVLLLVHDIDTRARDNYLKECIFENPALRQACVNNGHATERKRRSEEEGERIAKKLTNKLLK